MRNGFRFAFLFGLSALCYALYKPCRGWRPRQPAPVCLSNPAITPQMAVGANSVRPPLFAYMVCTNSPPATPRNGTSCFCKAEIALLPYRYSGKFLPPQNRSALCGYTFCFGIE